MKLKFSSLSITMTIDLSLDYLHLPTLARALYTLFSPVRLNSRSVTGHHSRYSTGLDREAQSTPTKKNLQKAGAHIRHRVVAPNNCVTVATYLSRRTYRDPKYSGANVNFSPFSRRITNGKT